MRQNLVFLFMLALAGCGQQFENDQNAFQSITPTQTIVINDDGQYDNIGELLSSGAQLYSQQCAHCHGSSGAGSPGTSILSSIRQDRAIAHTWQAMPPQSPSLCDQDCSIAIIAWVADQNGIALAIEFPDSNRDITANDPKTLEPTAQTFQRAVTLLAHSIPSLEELDEASHFTESELRLAIRNRLTGEGFRAFIKDGANDRLLVRGITQEAKNIVKDDFKEHYMSFLEDFKSGAYSEIDVAAELAESPLELIFHVVDNEKPYTEILTADYTMVSQHLASIYETGLAPAAGEWMQAEDNGQRIATTAALPKDNWENSRLIDRPEAGVLSSWAFTARYQTNETNRNRARAAQVMLHFLGYDIEASVPRFELEDADDFANPTMESPVCTACHTMLDPIAGAYQNFGKRGIFNENAFGQDSISSSYKKSDLYVENDTWYRDMLKPGYYDVEAPANSNGEGQTNSLVWLANQIAHDERFAMGAVKFWWPAVFGRDFQTADFQLMNALAEKFSTHVNLKDLLVDMVMSETYRYGRLNETQTPLVSTPELMSGKYDTLGIHNSSFMNSHRIFFGGHDSWETVERGRDINTVMLNVLRNNAFKHSCRMVFEDFSLPTNERTLFKSIELDVLPGSLKRVESLPATNSNSAIISTTKVTVTGQSRVSLAMRSTSTAKSYVTHFKIVNQNGSVIFDGSIDELVQSGGTIKNNVRIEGTKLGLFGTSDYAYLELPVLPTGTSEIEVSISHHPRFNNANGAVIAIDVIGNNATTSFASEQIKMQLVDLARVLWTETYSADSEEIEALYQLFAGLHSHAVSRGKTSTQFDNIRCEGIGNKSNVDLDYTFSAWKGVTATMLSDISFVLN